ncbi:MAG: hypothetical protein ACKO7O_01025 [Bacteroidota bacterium]
MSKFLSYCIGCLLFVFISIGCNANEKACSIPKASVIQEIEKWKAELLINGEVGPPCKRRYDKWIEENPNYYYGMQPVKELSSDLNEDGTEELLCYFPAVNCVGGNGTDSDFAMLLFHNDSTLLTNKRISLQIEEYIEATIYSNRQGEKSFDVADVNIFYESMTRTINGRYALWVYEDAHCCPSYEGTFSFDLFKLSIEMVDKKLGKITIDAAEIRGF